MNVINTISDKYFSFNGVNYARIYQPLAFGTRGVGIYNIYDTRQQLTNSEDFTEYTVNGNTYLSQSELIGALLLVTYRPADGGGGGGTDAIWGTITGNIEDQSDLQNELDGKEDIFSKNTAFNKNFGTTSGTVAEGNHLHSGVYEPVFSKNTGFNKNFGTSAGTVSEGNHTHTFAQITSKPTTLSGYGITDAYTKTQSDANYLGKTAKASDSDKLDNLDSSQFLRSDQSDTMTGNLTVTGGGVFGTSTYTNGGTTSTELGVKRTVNSVEERAVLAVNGSNGSALFQSSKGGYIELASGNGSGGLRYYNGTAYNKIWHEGNDGVGSGLDADLLRGVHWGNINTNVSTTGTVTASGHKTATWEIKEVGGNLEFHKNGVKKAQINSDGRITAAEFFEE